MCDFWARSEITDCTKLIRQVVCNYWENILLKIREMTANADVTYTRISHKIFNCFFFFCGGYLVANYRNLQVG